MGRAWLVVVVAACADPGHLPPPLTEVTQTPDGTTVTVTAPDTNHADYVLTFPAAGEPLPSSLTVGGVERLAGHADPCGVVQAGMGFAVPQVVVAAASNFGGATMGAADTSVELPGPGVGQVRIEWDAPYKCNGIANDSKGVSTFTTFPNGRIVWHEEMAQPTDQTLAAADQCSCSSTIGGVTFESFYRFVPGTDTTLDNQPAGSGAQLQQGCTTYQDASIAVSWPDTDTSIDGTSTWVHTWFKNQSTADNSAQKLTSAILVAQKAMDCQTLATELDDAMLVVDNVPIPNSNDDGIFVDGNSHLAPFDITAPNGVASFGLQIALSDHAIITPPHATDDAFFIAESKPADPGTLVIWFRDGLAPGESFHVEPQ